VSGHRQPARGVLPVQSVVVLHQAVRDHRGRWGETLLKRHARHDLFEQRFRVTVREEDLVDRDFVGKASEEAAEQS
jgi:hypothetical protein